MGLRKKLCEQSGEHSCGSRGVRISKRGPLNRPRIQVMEPRLVALKGALDLAQACGLGKLTVGERRELGPHAQRPGSPVAAVLFHKHIEPAPGNMLQQPVKDAIFVLHGIGHFRVQIVAKRPDRNRINVMRHVHKIKPDSRAAKAAVSDPRPR